MPQKSSPRISSKELQTFEGLVMGAGLDPSSFFRKLKADLATTPDPIRAANNLHRFLSTGFTSTILQDFYRHPVLQQLALELFAQSQYLADILVRDPELFRWLTASAALKSAKSRSSLIQEALASLQLFTRVEKKFDALKRFHRREMLRIGARDILGEADVPTITRELSALADAVVEAVLQIGNHDLATRTGAHFKSTLCIIGLGKLGGEELNFSSDIDLMFVYDEDGEFEAPQERIRTYHEYYNRLAESVVRRLTEFTSEGHLYRVDMRLRPEGNAGPLALSRLASLQYYEIRGSHWERQMLLKARPIAGLRETGEQWIQDLQPFVYPKTVLADPRDEIADMKRRIENEHEVKGNIKLGEGGIRDVEFIVQALQMLNGGEDEAVREPNTLNALERLKERKKISRTDAENLEEGYLFLRNLEHRLQLLHGAQTHSLPESAAETLILARRLGYPSEKRFTSSLRTHRKLVRNVFGSVFQKRQQLQPRGLRAVSALSLASLGIKDNEAKEVLESIVSNIPSLSSHDQQNRLLSLLKNDGAPRWGLKNLLVLASSSSLRRTLSQAFAKKEMAELLVRICSRSRMLTELLAREPLLFETAAGQPEDLFTIGWKWEYLMEHDPARFKLYNEFKILLPFLLGDVDIFQTTERLSELAEYMLSNTMESIPSMKRMCLVAVGKLGGKEITVGSDLDLLVIYEKGLDPSTAENAVKQFILQSTGSKGYEMDFRLRPEGKNAPLAIEAAYFEEYLSTRASLWERQSLLKARVILGDHVLTAKVKSLLARMVFEKPLPSGWTKEILIMRKAMEQERSKGRMDLKLGSGGLVDLEFFLQMVQLRFGATNDGIRETNSMKAGRALAKAGVISPREGLSLERNLRFLRTLEISIRMNSLQAGFVLPLDPEIMDVVRASLNAKTTAHLMRTIRLVQKENRAILKEVAKKCKA